MSLDGFGFPIASSQTVPAEALRVEAEYRGRSHDFILERQSSQIAAALGSARPRLGWARQAQPVAYFSGGGAGAGKTEIARAFIRQQPGGLDAVTIVDPDRFKEVIPEYARLCELGHPQAASIVHAESKAMSLLALRILLRCGSHCLYDSTLADAASNASLIEAAIRSGHQTVLIAATVHPEIALRRVLERGQRTRRYVPPDTVLWTHQHFVLSFLEYISWFDSCQLYDNNGPSGHPLRIAAATRGSTVAIDNETAWAQFFSYQSINPAAANPAEIGL